MKSNFTLPMHSDGKRITYDTSEMLQVAAAFKDKDFLGIFTPKKRSNKQNRSQFGIPYKLIAERLTETQGYLVTVDDVHALMKDRFKDILYEYAIDKSDIVLPGGENIKRPPSTANVSTVGHMRYYEALQQFGVLIGVDIPEPNEQDYKRIKDANA